MAIKLKQPRSGLTTVSQTASPLTKIGNASTGATTTYTSTTVTDSTAWDLSAITAGEIALGVYAKTADGYIGVVTAVNDTTDVVTVKAWQRPNYNENASPAYVPANAGACTLFRAVFAEKIILQAAEANSVNAFYGFNSALPSDGSDGMELSATAANPNSMATISKSDGLIDLTKLYVISASGSPKISWIAV